MEAEGDSRQQPDPIVQCLDAGVAQAVAKGVLDGLAASGDRAREPDERAKSGPSSPAQPVVEEFGCDVERCCLSHSFLT